MGRPKTKISKELLSEVKKELESIKDYKLALKLQAIVAYSTMPAQKVAEVFHVSRVTIHLWVKRFASGGIDALIDKPKGHYPAKLNETHKSQIRDWLVSCKDSNNKHVHWTLRRMQREIQNVFGIDISTTQIWYTFKDIGFNIKKPRPRHEKGDRETQDQFKKK